MASVTNYSGYNQASAQQAYGSYAAQPAQGYGQTAQGYSQQDYSSYGQPAATESAYGQTAAAAGGYTQQQYGASYGQSAAPAAYGTPQAGAQGYTQSAQGYGTSGYASSAAAPAAQASYSGQQSYGAQTAYSSYSQQPAASAPQSAYGASTQASYTQAGYAQPQAGYQGQQAGYAGQQQAAYGAPQQAQSAGFPQQPNGSYGQHAAPQSYDQYSGYSQGGVSGGYSGSQQPPSRGGYPGAGDSPGPGRDSFDRGGMRGGPRGRAPMGRGGMGMAGDRGGFSKPGGHRDGADSEMGQQDDSENSTIYITGLTENATLPEMADFFKHTGPIRINRRLGQPAINIYTDRETGKPKGDATLSYEEPQVARAAVEHFDGKEFQGRRLKVSMARRKMVPGGMRGMPMRGGPDRGGMMGRGGERGGFPPRGGPRGGMGWNGPPGPNNIQKRAGDWECPNAGCGNQNFSWRTECNQCKAPKPEGLGPPDGGDRGRGMGRGGRGMDRGPPGMGGPVGMRGGWGDGGFRGRGGMDRGGFRGRGGPPMDRGGRRGMGPPGKMDGREHRQERRDRPY
ncbi:RNA-binding protein EWS-like isoform X2 [Hoplias malabaricus]|uniref:RNA-binding protein EWS-like isoform X2 n=1 Tax=Hoplias malabaricus TaxID=27720 RepID=UPI003461D224